MRSYGDESDGSLLHNSREGDSAAFAELFARYKDRVFRRSVGLLQSVTDAEDVTSMVFLELWRRRTTVSLPDGTIWPWLSVTANYVVKNRRRSQLRYGRLIAKLPSDSVVDDHAESVLDDLQTASDVATLRAALSKLGSLDRDIVTLCIVDDVALADAAQILGVPLGTVKSRLSRAKARLRAYVAVDTVTQRAPEPLSLGRPGSLEQAGEAR